MLQAWWKLAQGSPKTFKSASHNLAKLWEQGYTHTGIHHSSTRPPTLSKSITDARAVCKEVK